MNLFDNGVVEADIVAVEGTRSTNGHALDYFAALAVLKLQGQQAEPPSKVVEAGKSGEFPRPDDVVVAGEVLVLDNQIFTARDQTDGVPGVIFGSKFQRKLRHFTEMIWKQTLTSKAPLRCLWIALNISVYIGKW